MDILTFLTSAPFVTAAGTLFVTVTAGIIAWATGRGKLKAEIHKSASDAFRDLTNELQEERRELSDIIRDQKNQITDLEQKVILAAQRRQDLIYYIMELQRLLRNNGIAFPSYPQDEGHNPLPPMAG